MLPHALLWDVVVEEHKQKEDIGNGSVFCCKYVKSDEIGR